LPPGLSFLTVPTLHSLPLQSPLSTRAEKRKGEREERSSAEREGESIPVFGLIEKERGKKREKNQLTLQRPPVPLDSRRRSGRPRPQAELPARSGRRASAGSWGLERGARNGPVPPLVTACDCVAALHCAKAGSLCLRVFLLNKDSKRGDSTLIGCERSIALRNRGEARR
jgi:hypothetical protein